MSVLTKEITLPKLSGAKLGGAMPKLSRRNRLGAGRTRRSGSAVTGLEIGATHLMAAHANQVDGRITVERLAVRPIPAGLVRDGLVLDAAGLAAEMRGLFSDHKLDKRVRLGLATPRTVLRVIDVPPIAESDVAAVLPALAQETMPMPLGDAALDFHSIGLVDTPEGRRLRLIVVAAESKGIETLAETAMQAGLRPVGIDLSIFAAMRAVSAPPSTEPVLYAQLGDLVSLAIAEQGVCLFTRQAPQGTALVLSRLAEQTGKSPEAVQQILDAARAGSDTQFDDGDLREVHMLLARVAQELANELRTTAEFYGTQHGSSVTHGIVSGTLAALPGFIDALADASGMTLQAGETTFADPRMSAVLDPRVAAVAAGLSIDRVS